MQATNLKALFWFQLLSWLLHWWKECCLLPTEIRNVLPIFRLNASIIIRGKMCILFTLFTNWNIQSKYVFWVIDNSFFPFQLNELRKERHDQLLGGITIFVDLKVEHRVFQGTEGESSSPKKSLSFTMSTLLSRRLVKSENMLAKSRLRWCVSLESRWGLLEEFPWSNFTVSLFTTYSARR